MKLIYFDNRHLRLTTRLRFEICTGLLLLVSASLILAQDAGKEINEKGEVIAPKDAAPAKPITAATMDLLRAIEAKHGASTTVQGSFEQTKESEVFLETIKSKGAFSFQKPDLFRIDYTPLDADGKPQVDAGGKPQNQTTTLIVKDAIYVHTPALKQVERYKFHSPEERDQQLHIMVLGFGFKAETVAKEYEVRSSEDDPELADELKGEGHDPAKMALILAIPVASLRDTSPFVRLKLWVDKTSLIPQKIWFEDPSGDHITISNMDVTFDVPFASSLFEAKFPSGTAMIDRSE